MQLLHQRYHIQGQEKAANCLVYTFFHTTLTFYYYLFISYLNLTVTYGACLYVGIFQSLQLSMGLYSLTLSLSGPLDLCSACMHVASPGTKVDGLENEAQAGFQPGSAQPLATAPPILVSVHISVTYKYFPYNTLLKPTYVFCYM